MKGKTHMFGLKDSRGKIVLKKDGTPFKYTTQNLAYTGKRLLEGERKEKLTIVEV